MNVMPQLMLVMKRFPTYAMRSRRTYARYARRMYNITYASSDLLADYRTQSSRIQLRNVLVAVSRMRSRRIKMEITM